MNQKIGILAPTAEYAQLLHDMFLKEIYDGELLIEAIIPHQIVQQGEMMIKKGAQALMARGGTYHDLKQSIYHVPLVEIPVSDSDLLAMLSVVRKKYQKVYLILSSSSNFDLEEYRDLLDMDIAYYRFNKFDDLQQYIEEIPYDPQTMVLGGGITVSYAKRKLLATMHIENKASTIYAAYESAKQIIQRHQEETQKVRLLESLLSNVDDGVVVVDSTNRILHFNRRSEQLFNRAADKVLQQNVVEVLPEMIDLLEKFQRKQEKTIGIIKIKLIDISVTVDLIQIGLGDTQTIIMLKDITKLQELEKSIRVQLHKKGLTARYAFDDILTKENNMKLLIQRAQRCAIMDNTVLIYGESGTGKELFAQSIHNYSRRKNQPFVAVNCAALTESLLESELFGYVPGAFTGAQKEGKIGLFELAHGGTIFLDEVNSMSLSTQAKILRIIEEREVMRVGSDYIIPLDVRIIAATNDNLIDLIKQERFRRDLYFRLNVLEIHIPPLDKRPKDIIFLFKSFASEMTKQSLQQIKIDKAFEQQLLAHSWWGNVRELRNVCFKYVVFEGDNSSGDILPLVEQTSEQFQTIGDDMRIDLKEVNRAVESLIIESLLGKGVNKTDTAKLLGISRTALFKKMERNKK